MSVVYPLITAKGTAHGLLQTVPTKDEHKGEQIWLSFLITETWYIFPTENVISRQNNNHYQDVPFQHL